MVGRATSHLKSRNGSKGNRQFKICVCKEIRRLCPTIWEQRIWHSGGGERDGIVPLGLVCTNTSGGTPSQDQFLLIYMHYMFEYVIYHCNDVFECSLNEHIWGETFSRNNSFGYMHSTYIEFSIHLLKIYIIISHSLCAQKFLIPILAFLYPLHINAFFIEIVSHWTSDFFHISYSVKRRLAQDHLDFPRNCTTFYKWTSSSGKSNLGCQHHTNIAFLLFDANDSKLYKRQITKKHPQGIYLYIWTCVSELQYEGLGQTLFLALCGEWVNCLARGNPVIRISPLLCK